MPPLLALLLVVLGGFAFVAFLLWLERATRQPGLAFGIVGASGLISAVMNFSNGKPVFALVLIAQAIAFLYLGWLRRTGRLEGPRVPDA